MASIYEFSSRVHIRFLIKASPIFLLLAFLPAGCSTLKQPSIGVLLPETCNTPDGMALAADGNIYLSCPNSNNDKYRARLMKITPDDRLEEFYVLPVHPETHKSCPLGIGIGPDGHLYIADNQGLAGAVNKSRLLRVLVKKGKPAGFDVLATGLNQANAVVCRPDGVYVTETSIAADVKPMPSGVYRFRYSEFRAGKPVEITPGGKDSHLIATIYTDNPDWPVGANGLTFDSQGNMYVGNFGQAAIVRFTFDKDGNVTSQKVLVRSHGIESTDGMKFDPKTNAIYLADFVGNAVHKIDTKTGAVTTIAKDAKNSGGIGGMLDMPSEVCLRDGRLYVSNIDLPLAGNEFDEPHTISVIELDD
jgi:sugar lactone lactonase YvrE